MLHISIVPSEKLAVLCRAFFQHPTAQVFLNHEAAVDACDTTMVSDRWISTHMSTWQQHTNELTHNNIFLETWPQPNLHLIGHEHVFKTQFQLLPKWACEAQRILKAKVARTFPSVILDSKSSPPEVVNIVSIHVRRTDYLNRRRPSVSGKYLTDLVDRGYQGILSLWPANVSDHIQKLVSQFFVVCAHLAIEINEKGDIFSPSKHKLTNIAIKYARYKKLGKNGG